MVDPAVFVAAALEDRKAASLLLEEDPSVGERNLWCALVAGNTKSVEALLTSATVAGGPRDWPPLQYACFSLLTRGVDTAKLLLERGADPNTCDPLSCLYAASGLKNDPALAELLLKAGANPNDNESLYHSTEHAGLACTQLLLRYGAKPAPNDLKHMLDREEPRGVELLLRHGADPNARSNRGQTALHWAVWRERGTAVLRALLNAGAELDAKRDDGRAAYAIAVQTGQTTSADLLSAAGADTAVPELDAWLADCARADESELQQLLERPPARPVPAESYFLLADFAARNSLNGVRAALSAGIPVNARGELGATALHWACWKGFPDIADLLLRQGASSSIEDEQYHGTPGGWFAHGLRNCREPGGNYLALARVLTGAGAAIPAADIPTGVPEIDALLRSSGLID